MVDKPKPPPTFERGVSPSKPIRIDGGVSPTKPPPQAPSGGKIPPKK